MSAVKINRSISPLKLSLTYWLFSLLFLCITRQANAQANDIVNAFTHYKQQVLSEKLFAHTDKTFYVAGEIIWFKIYSVDAGFHAPLDLSKVAYAEILDDANKPVLQAKIALKHAAGDGSFLIPLTISSGSYKFRAYTNWMKNAGPGAFFEKNITIVNTQRTTTANAPDTVPEYDIQFFPEGGNLAEGLESRLAFKATDQFGKGIGFTAHLYDNDKRILAFEPEHAGMGNFSFTPQANHRYKAVIHLPGGKSITKELPQVYRQGYVMAAEDAGDQLKIRVQSANLPQEAIHLIVHDNAGIKAVQSQTTQDNKAVFAIDKSTFDDGISHITIFNNDKQPVCERLYFKKPAKHLQINLVSDHASYGTRSKVELNLQLPNNSPVADSANLSMSVYKIDSLQDVDETSIETYLLLSAELIGYVENPSWYFETTATEAAIDNLLLTQGWRRFDWNNVLRNEQPVFRFAPEYNGHIITGTVYNTKTGNIQKYVESYLSVMGTKLQFYPSTSDTNGLVKFEMRDFYGSSEIAVQAGTQFMDSIYKLEISNPFYNKYSTQRPPAFHLPRTAPNTLLERSIGMQVQHIYTGDKIKQLVDAVSDTSSFYPQPGKTYLLDDYTRFKTLEEVLREYVALVNVAKRDGKYHFPVYNVASKEFFLVDPLNLVDGVPVFNIDKFLQTDPLQMRKLDVINQRYIYGGSSFNGLLSWTSYNGNLAGYQPDKTTVFLNYEALQLQREFYTPAYDTEEKRNSHVPDFRNVLLWSPNIQALHSKTQHLSFYTSDIPGKYAIQIQGISSTGACGSKTVFINVEK